GPVFAWGTGDQNGGEIEIREVEDEDGVWKGRVRFDADMAVQKTFILDYSLWFIGGPTLTISVPASDAGINGVRGLFAGGDDDTSPRFYGTASYSGGQNLARPAAKVVVKQGNTLSARFITEEETAMDISPSSGEITIHNAGAKGDPTAFIDGSGKAYFHWTWK
ncbi:MAG: hypothetical protein LBH50_01620, partial [Spirochaetaceae bacterium]|nr:hypothetical protein [Spirochaetaceae bacterium]